MNIVLGIGMLVLAIVLFNLGLMLLPERYRRYRWPMLVFIVGFILSYVLDLFGLLP